MTTIPTALFIAFPKRYLKPLPDDFDVYKFSNVEYEWTSDRLNGYADFSADPLDTIESGAGDCDDYARVIASWLYYETDRPIYLGLMWSPGHLVVSDGDRVYSSGIVVSDTTIEEFADDNNYNKFVWTRTVRE